MEQGGVRVRTYEPEDPRLRADRAEIRRYAGMARGVTAEDAGTESLLAEVMEEMKGAFAYRVCYLRTGIAWDGDIRILHRYRRHYCICSQTGRYSAHCS